MEEGLSCLGSRELGGRVTEGESFMWMDVKVCGNSAFAHPT